LVTLQKQSTKTQCLIGLIVLVAAAAVGIADLVHWLEVGEWKSTLFGDIAFSLFPETLNIIQAVVQRYVWAYLWDPIIQTFLLLPVLPTLCAIGLVLFLWAKVSRWIR
jgi:hypothetical protein